MIKKVLILGASSDIGLQLVKYYLKNKWNVVAHYSSNNSKLNLIKSPKLKIVKLNFSEINEKNKKIIYQKFDDNYDALVNLVGYIDNKNFDNLDIDSALQSIKINAIIPLVFIEFLSKKMSKNKWGRIVNCSSIGVKYGGGTNTFNYSLSKQTLEFIPMSLRNLAKKNVYVNVIRLGVVKTKIHNKIKNKNLDLRKKLIPAGKIASIDDVINFIYFLGSEKNQFITGENISVSGGE